MAVDRQTDNQRRSLKPSTKRESGPWTRKQHRVRAESPDLDNCRVDTGENALVLREYTDIFEGRGLISPADSPNASKKYLFTLWHTDHTHRPDRQMNYKVRLGKEYTEAPCVFLEDFH